MIDLDYSDVAKLSPEEMLKALGGRLMTPEEEAQAKQVSEKIRLGKKYRKSMKTLTRFDIIDMLKEQPDMPLNLVLAAIVKKYDPKMPPSVLSEMTRYIIAEWEGAQVKMSEKPEPALV